MKTGIYVIKNIINNHMYIGSSKSIKNRWKRHRWELRHNKHHSIYLQRAWNKYKEENFVFEILEECDITSLFEREQYFIDLLKPSYNLGAIYGGDNISNHPNIDIIRQKHSENSKNRYKKLTNEEKVALSLKVSKDQNPNWKGGVSTPNCAVCGQAISYGHTHCTICSKIGSENPFYGKHHSEESKEKIRKGKIGKKPANTQKVEIEGKIYESKADAAKALGVSNGLISYRFKMKYPNYHIVTETLDKAS